MLTRYLPCLAAALVPVGVMAESGPGQAADVPAVTDFIRVHEDGSAARLQTALTRYRKGEVTVDLIGAIHIADKGYYESLNRRFDEYDAMLFEMIGGGEKEPAAAKDEARQGPEAKRKPTKGKGGKRKAAAEGKGAAEDGADAEDGAAAAQAANLAMLRGIYGMVSRFLALSDQMAVIDYTKKHFVHADLSMEEFERLQGERGESLLGFALEAGRKAEEAGGAGGQPDLQQLMRALLSGNPNAVKLEIVHTLGRGDDQIAAFAGESVIIGDRNAKCVEVLGEQVKAGKRKLGIFYGAAHFPDMEKRLSELGYRRERQEWLTAWDIPKAKPAAEQEKQPEQAAEPLKDAA